LPFGEQELENIIKELPMDKARFHKFKSEFLSSQCQPQMH